jgi:DNA-binding NarL/FixJ family response regulator
MRYPQLLVYESDGRLAERLRALARDRRWSLREPRRPEACVRLLRHGGPNVLVLKLGRNLESEMALLQQVSTNFPETASIVVADTDKPALTGLAWDLGARYVLVPAQPHERLIEVVAAFLTPPEHQPPDSEKR